MNMLSLRCLVFGHLFTCGTLLTYITGNPLPPGTTCRRCGAQPKWVNPRMRRYASPAVYCREGFPGVLPWLARLILGVLVMIIMWGWIGVVVYLAWRIDV